MTPQNLPVIGAALSILDLPHLRGWLLEDARDIELQDFCFASVLNGDWRTFTDIARRQLDGWQGRLGIHGPFAGFEVDTTDPDIRDIVRRRLDQALDVCDALKATQMVIHSPYRSWDHHNLDIKPHARTRKIEAAHACLSGAVTRAASQGITLVLENIQDIDPMDRKHLAESFGTEAVRVSVDTGHAHYAHKMTGAPPVNVFIAAAGEMLAHVHLQDADGYADRHWAIGEGTVCWPAVFRALDEIKAQPHLVLEINDNSGIPASLDHLSALGLAR